MTKINNNIAKHWSEVRDELVIEKINGTKPRIKPLTKGQEAYFRAIETSTVTFVTGNSGTGKTFIAVGIAAQMLKDERIDRIILTRPLISCGYGVGFLPGDVYEK